MRIAMVTGACDPRRIERGDLRTGSHAQLHGVVHGAASVHDVVLHGPDRGGLPPEDDATATLRSDPVPTGDVDVTDARDAHTVAAGIEQFSAALAERWRARRPDVIHAHDWFAGAAARRAIRATRDDLGETPLVVSLGSLGHVHRRHLGETPASGAIRLAVESDLARSADLLVATCVDQHRELLQLGAPRDRAVTIPPGVDGARFTTPRAQPRRETTSVVTVSDLAEHRGTEAVIAATLRIPDAVLTVVGGPPAALLATDPRVAELRALAARHDGLERVRFVGRVRNGDMPALLGAADVVVQVPWFTGFGRVTIEALACGRAVIASAVGGQLDSVEHGINGILVPARDTHGLHEALRKVLLDPRARTALAAAARPRTLDRFGWPRVSEPLLQAYERVAVPTTDLAEVAEVAT